MIEHSNRLPKIAWLRRVIGWTRRHQIWSIVLVGVFLILVVSTVGALLYLQKPKSLPAAVAHAVKPKPVPPPVYYSLLTGEKIGTQAGQTATVTAIMIENSPDARPQSGLKQAGVVYEAIAEGGITRFLTLHQQDKPGLIGPVRSLRQYYLDWLTPYNAAVAHVGGSEEALSQVRNGSYRDMDEFFNGAYYWRATDRYAPHNVYTNFTKLDAMEQAKGYTSSTFTSFQRTDAAPSTQPNASQIAIDFSGPLYNTTYQWDKSCDCYPRSEGGAPHLDREDGQIQPAVVVAMHVDERTVLQDGYREQITTSGTGEADIFQNGTVTKATWSKKDQTSPLQLIDATGKDIPLVRGQTWIAAVPNGNGSVTWQ